MKHILMANNNKKFHFLSMKFLVISLAYFGAATLEAKAKPSEITVEQRYASLQKSMQIKNYKSAAEEARALLAAAPASPFAGEATFDLGVAYFHLRDFDLSNHFFSEFLEKFATSNYFEEAIEYKYKIAEEFEAGSGRHIFGLEQLPKWLNAWEDAMTIYDEVIKTLPNHEVAAKALFHKGGMLRIDRKYKESIDSYRAVVRRFPKHPLSPESYLEMAKVYSEQSKEQYPDSNFLAQAKLNLKNFRRDFPSEDRLIEAEALLIEMQDHYAKDLWVSAKYFDKKKKYDAARLYYEKIARVYPESIYAKEAVARLLSSDDGSMLIEEQEELIKEAPYEQLDQTLQFQPNLEM